jgi:hypothetical protein
MRAGKWTILRTEIEGWYLLAPTTYLSASEEIIDEKTGGCGPGWLGDKFVPDTMLGESVYLACRIHDWMYGEGENLQDKKVADRCFLWNMTVLLQETPFTHETEHAFFDMIRLRTSMTYYQAVYYGGGDAFDQGESPRE